VLQQRFAFGLALSLALDAVAFDAEVEFDAGCGLAH
jgi:hypothetical protein